MRLYRLQKWIIRVQQLTDHNERSLTLAELLVVAFDEFLVGGGNGVSIHRHGGVIAFGAGQLLCDAISQLDQRLDDALTQVLGLGWSIVAAMIRTGCPCIIQNLSGLIREIGISQHFTHHAESITPRAKSISSDGRGTAILFGLGRIEKPSARVSS